MRKLSLLGRKRKELDTGSKAVKQIITGIAIPKSLSMIELEKNYAFLAEMMSRMIDRMQKLENDIETLEKRMSHLLRSKKVKHL